MNKKQEKALRAFVSNNLKNGMKVEEFACEIAKFVESGYNQQAFFDIESCEYTYTFNKAYKAYDVDTKTNLDLTDFGFKIDMYRYMDREGDGVLLEARFVDNGKTIRFYPDHYLMDHNILYWLEEFSKELESREFEIHECDINEGHPTIDAEKYLEAEIEIE